MLDRRGVSRRHTFLVIRAVKGGRGGESFELSDDESPARRQGFAVEHVAIVGKGLRSVEQVSSRMSGGRAALIGAGYGALIGARPEAPQRKRELGATSPSSRARSTASLRP
jgi:Heat induced stress protein YflT domain